MILYYHAGACSLAVHIALIEAAIPYKLVSIDRDKRTEDGRDFVTVNARSNDDRGSLSFLGALLGTSSRAASAAAAPKLLRADEGGACGRAGAHRRGPGVAKLVMAGS